MDFPSDSGESCRQRTMLAAIEVRNRHPIPVIRCTGVSAQEFGPAGLDNHRDPVMASHLPRGED
jgi:predicted dienelactone hydrolase